MVGLGITTEREEQVDSLLTSELYQNVTGPVYL